MKYLKKYEGFRIDENFFKKSSDFVKNLFKSDEDGEPRIEGERKSDAILTLFDLPIIDPYKMTPIPPEQIPVHCKNCKRPYLSIIKYILKFHNKEFYTKDYRLDIEDKKNIRTIKYKII